ELLAPGEEVLRLLAVGVEAQVRVALDLLVGYGQLEAVSERLELVLVELLLLVGDVLSLASRAEPVPFDGTREDDGGLALVLDGGIERGEDLERVMAAA